MKRAPYPRPLTAWDVYLESVERGFMLGGFRFLASCLFLTIVIAFLLGGVS